MAQLGQVLHGIANEPLPPYVKSEVSLWQHITGRLQTVLGSAVTAGTTFGLFRGLGTLAIPARSGNYGNDVSATIRAVLVGGVAGGVGNTLAATVLTPVATALMSQVMGNSTAFAPIDPEQLVPQNYPHRHDQMQKVREAQSKFGVDSLTNILAGMLSFGGANAVRAAGTVNAGLSPVTNWAFGAATSAGAGGLNAFITDAFRGSSSVELTGPDGQTHSVNVFQPVSTSPKAVGPSVQNAFRALAGQGGLLRTSGQLGIQAVSRAGAVTASTLPLAALQAAIPNLTAALLQKGATSEQASQAASAVLNLVGFAAVVAIYFNGLGMIGRALPQRLSVTQPQQPQQLARRR